MRHRAGQHILAAIALLGLLASCSPGPQAGGGIGGTGSIASIASGPITGFGSIFVSRSEYETGSTSMEVDGKPGSQNDLRKGMIVRVNATVTRNTGTSDSPQRTANALLYEDTVEGIVQSVAPDGSTLVVLGQTIAITATTNVDASIEGGNVRNLVPDRDLVEISGFVTGNGTINGTFVALKTGGSTTEMPDYEVKGFIKNHDAGRKIFEIGSLTINYRDAELIGMPDQSSTLWNGLLVDIRGTQVLAESFGAGGLSLHATRAKLEVLSLEDSEAAVLEGIVTKVLSPGNFFLGNVQVLTNARTTIQGGTPSDVLVGAHLEVHGLLTSGVVTATKVEFERDVLKGSVTEVLSPSEFFVGNVRVFTNVGTIFEGGTPNDIVVGAHLEVYGPAVNGIVNATKVEFERETPLPAKASCLDWNLSTKVDGEIDLLCAHQDPHGDNQSSSHQNVLSHSTHREIIHQRVTKTDPGLLSITPILTRSYDKHAGVSPLTLDSV